VVAGPPDKHKYLGSEPNIGIVNELQNIKGTDREDAKTAIHERSGQYFNNVNPSISGSRGAGGEEEQEEEKG
jgi:hypothetical protein